MHVLERREGVGVNIKAAGKRGGLGRNHEQDSVTHWSRDLAGPSMLTLATTVTVHFC